MPCGCASLASLYQVARGSLMQPPLPGLVLGKQLGLQNLPDQLVIAVGAGLVIHDRHEHVRAVEELQHLRRFLAPHRGAGSHRKFVEDRGGQHEVGDFGRLAGKDLVQEVIGDSMTVQLHPPSSSARVGGTLDR